MGRRKPLAHSPPGEQGGQLALFDLKGVEGHRPTEKATALRRQGRSRGRRSKKVGGHPGLFDAPPGGHPGPKPQEGLKGETTGQKDVIKPTSGKDVRQGGGVGAQRYPAQPEAPQRQTLTVPQVAKILGIGRGTAYELARTGRLPVIRLGRRMVVSKIALEEMLRARQQGR